MNLEHNYKLLFKASLLVALSGTLYGFLGYLGTSLLKANMNMPSMLFWRFFIAGIWMLFFVLRQQRPKTILMQFKKRTLLSIFVIGGLFYAGSSQFYFVASEYTGTGLAMVIFFSYPIIIALFSWLTKSQQINFLTLISLIAMAIGLFFIQDTSDQAMQVIGIMFAIIAASCYAFYVMGSKYISYINMNSNLLTSLICLGCAIIFFISAIGSHRGLMLPQDIHTWVCALALGIIATAIPIQLMLEGLKHISSMRASIISVLEPLVTVLVGVLLLHESLSFVQILGVFIILTSAIFVQFQKGL